MFDYFRKIARQYLGTHQPAEVMPVDQIVDAVQMNDLIESAKELDKLHKQGVAIASEWPFDKPPIDELWSLYDRASVHFDRLRRGSNPQFDKWIALNDKVAKNNTAAKTAMGKANSEFVKWLKIFENIYQRRIHERIAKMPRPAVYGAVYGVMPEAERLYRQAVWYSNNKLFNTHYSSPLIIGFYHEYLALPDSERAQDQEWQMLLEDVSHTSGYGRPRRLLNRVQSAEYERKDASPNYQLWVNVISASGFPAKLNPAQTFPSNSSALPQTLSADTPESEYSQPLWNLYHKAFKIYNDKSKIEQPLNDDDVRTILDLYRQTGFTSAPRTWAGLLADVYESENHSFTDHGKARELRVQTAFRPKGEVQAYSLAHNYFNPPPGGEIDNKRAVYWLTIAAKQFDHARDLAIQMINYHDELAPLRAHLPALVSEMNYDLADPKELRTDAGHFLARAHNAGLYGLPVDQAKAQVYYHAVATRDVDWSPEQHPDGLKHSKREAALAAATRSLLGIGTNFDPRAAVGYAQALYNACDPDDISHSDNRYAAMRIQHLARSISGSGQQPNTQTILRTAEAVIAKRLSPEKLSADLQSGAIPCSELLEGCLWLLNTYLEDECVGYPSYQSCVAQIQVQVLGHTQVHHVENQFRYNFIDATQKPILGAIVPPSDGAQPQGFGRFRGLAVTATGDIDYAFDKVDQSTGHLPLIVPEDIKVALALAFGDRKPIWPTFSAEPPAPMTPTSPKWIPFTAQWTPQWLGHTTLGNTLFATDCEAGPLLLWKIGSAQVADDQGRSPSLARLKSIIAKMSDVQDNSSGRTNFLTFKVAAVELTWSQTEQSRPRCTVNKAVVGLQTGTIDERGATTYTNNKDFATGYRAALFNSNLDLFAEHYPLLERYRQLATLVTALNQLRQRGFEPAEPIRTAITDSYNSYVRRPAPVQANQLFY